MDKIHAVFSCDRGIVTDIGGPLELRRQDALTIELPRYGVWKPGRKWECVHVTDDLEEAIAKAKE